MLKEEVIEAVSAGEFAIFTVTKVSEAVELMLSKPMGTPNKKGDYPINSVLGKIQKIMHDIKMHELKDEQGQEGSKPPVMKNITRH